MPVSSLQSRQHLNSCLLIAPRRRLPGGPRPGPSSEDASAAAAAAAASKSNITTDRYPCLRRALSCSETPILPLGTYALEFGFDVSTLPFVPPPPPPPPSPRSISSYCPTSTKTSVAALLQPLDDDDDDPGPPSSTDVLLCNTDRGMTADFWTPHSRIAAASETLNGIDEVDGVASIWKKDKRMWLWKSNAHHRRKRRSLEEEEEEDDNEDVGEEEVVEPENCPQEGAEGQGLGPPPVDEASGKIFAKRWKKDNRTWLWKSSCRSSD